MKVAQKLYNGGKFTEETGDQLTGNGPNAGVGVLR